MQYEVAGEVYIEVFAVESCEDWVGHLGFAESNREPIQP